MFKRLFTSESVSVGHPDKVSDQISDAILDSHLEQDPNAHVACETMVTENNVVVAGEISSKAKVDVEEVIRETIREIGYDRDEYGFNADTVKITNLLHEQSPDIAMGVDDASGEDRGAGDQGIMFGYACDETPSFMPLTIDLAHRITRKLAEIRREGKVMKYLRPDAKSQVTVEYDENWKPVAINTILVSTQHDVFASDKEMQKTIFKDIASIVLPAVKAESSEEVQKLFEKEFDLITNPTGRFVIGGPTGDTGLTGRKIIVDTYGGWGGHGGGAFSGKDSSKVDRSAAYAARHIDKNLVAAGVCKKVLIQLSYAIGMAEPISVNVNTYGTAVRGLTDERIAEVVYETFDLRPAAIERRLGLRAPIYKVTAENGHFGHESFIIPDVTPKFGETSDCLAFPWEKLDYACELHRRFGFDKANCKG